MSNTATAPAPTPSTVTPSGGGRVPSAADYSSLFPTGQQINQAQTDLVALTKQKMAADAAAQSQFDKRDAQTRTQMQRAIEAEGADIQDLKPWDANAELSKRETPLWEQWGSPAVFAANLLSAFTHTPMTNALNASAAAMQTIQKGDLDSYNRAMDAWKQNSELAQKRAALENEQYEQIDHLRQTDMAEWRAKATALAARFNDLRGLALLQNGMDPEFLQVKQATFESMAKLPAIEEQIFAQQNKINMLNGVSDGKGGRIGGDPDWLSGDPKRMKLAMDRVNSGDLSPEQAAWQQLNDEHPDWGYDQKIKAYAPMLEKLKQAEFPYRGIGSPATMQKVEEKNAVKAAVKKDHPDWSDDKVDLEADKRIRAAQAAPVSGNERLKQEAHVEQYDLALDDIIPQVEDILRRHVGAVGAAGYATRAGESVSNILGGDATDRRQLQSDIEQLQLMAPNLLLDRTTGRPLSTEHAAIDEIIRGLNLGDTTANTLRSITELKRRLGVLRADAASRIGEGPAAPTSEALVAGQSGWSDFPEVK